MSAAPVIHAPFETDDVLREMYQRQLRLLEQHRSSLPEFDRLTGEAIETCRRRLRELDR